MDAVGNEANLICLLDRMSIVGFNNTVILGYEVQNPVDAELVGNALYVAVENAVYVIVDGRVVETYSCSPQT